MVCYCSLCHHGRKVARSKKGRHGFSEGKYVLRMEAMSKKGRQIFFREKISPNQIPGSVPIAGLF